MILILDVTAPHPMTPGGASRQTFGEQGGSIGRDHDNSWVLPHAKVSGHHAVISHRDGVFSIEDRSRNGVCLNSSTNRLMRGRPYALEAGDRILIDPYEILVSIARDQRDQPGVARQDFSALAGIRSPEARFDADNPFDIVDATGAPRPSHSPGLESPAEAGDGEVLDPLLLLQLPPRDPSPRNAPSAKNLDRGFPLDVHYHPPEAIPAPVLEPESGAGALAIPPDYDPLAPDDPPAIPLSGTTTPARSERPVSSAPEEQTAPQLIAPPPPFAPGAPAEAKRDRPPATRAAESPAGSDLAAVLAGAGLASIEVTPELAQTFGEILRVVVSGVMDVMRSRQQIKDEFRLRMTRLMPAGNNPLKSSANVDDALHNLLVKRNPAYLAPVEAFEDAFADLRNHQVAMLAGMRVAFASMLAEFDPERLQQEFDRRLGIGLVPAKLRYWDLFRERRLDLVNDPDATFRRLFGNEFARAYEEQLQQLKAQEIQARRPTPRPPEPPET